jgi:4-hydroxymandelate synthase
MREKLSTTSAADVGVDYLEMYVGDLERAAFTWVDQYAFTVVGTGGAAEHRSVALRHGAITLVLTEATSDRHPAAEYVLTHGDGIADIALRTTDAAAAFHRAVAHGARAVREPTTHAGPGAAVTAAVEGFPGVVHTLVQRDRGAGPGLPVGFVPALRAAGDRTAEVGLLDIDHIAICLHPGDVDRAAGFYRDGFGFQEIFAQRIVIGAHAMPSTVVRGGTATLALLAPDRTGEPGQADEFLKSHQGAGVQHVAFSTGNAVRTVHALGRRGVTFLGAPDGYYDRLNDRIPLGEARVEALRAADVLADADHAGRLFQVFTASTHARSTLFFEVVERDGAETFGRDNVHALYQAMELERTGRHGGGR